MSKHTTLHALHLLEQRAKMVDFAGWMMPLHYDSQLEEHRIVRSSCGVFDISHMGIIEVEGIDATPFLRTCLANDVAKIEPGRSLYSCLLREDGKILDDLIAYQLTSHHYRLIVNAATTEKDLHWLQQQVASFQVTLALRSDLSILAIQGPEAAKLISSAISSLKHVHELPPFHCIAVQDGLLARTGYTGEDGFEWVIPNTKVIELWCKLMGVGARPAGLGARDSLRLEAGFNLYGQDMDETVTPLDVDLERTVAFSPLDRSFIGREALERQQKLGTHARLLGVLLSEAGMLRHGMELIAEDGSLGFVTSGTFSPVLKKSIGLARFSHWQNQRYSVIIRDQLHPVQIVQQPFVKHGAICFEKIEAHQARSIT